MAEEEKTFPVTYDLAFHKPGVPQSELEGRGGADAVVICTVGFADGETQYAFQTLDGRTGENLHPRQMMSAWEAMARYLSAKLEPGSGAQELTEEVCRVLQSARQMQEDAARESRGDSEEAN